MEVEIWLWSCGDFSRTIDLPTVFFLLLLAFDMDKLGKISQLPYKERS